jgi:cytochrome c553
MFKTQSMILMILVLLLAATGTAIAAEPSNSPTAVDGCAACHAEFSSLLPKGHVEVKEPGLAACLGCHSLGQAGEAKKNAFSTRIHLAHAAPQLRLDCVACHSFAAGKSFGLIGQSSSWGAPKEADMEAMKKAFASWVNSDNMDHLHAKATVDCAGCHGKQAPQTESTVENSRCLACHGPQAELVAKSKPKDFPNRNPHESHLGEAPCTVCHHAHAESRSYCLECHQNFNMPIPGGAKE